MINKLKKLPLSILVIIVSVLSLALVQQQVFAGWDPPDGPPPVGETHLFVNPMIEDLDLNSNTIIDASQASFVLNPGGPTALNISGTNWAGYFDGNLNITSELCFDEVNCIDEWADVAGGAFWQAGAGTEIYYNQAGGNVGIGIANPNYLLHVDGIMRANDGLRSGGSMQFDISDNDDVLVFKGMGTASNHTIRFDDKPLRIWTPGEGSVIYIATSTDASNKGFVGIDKETANYPLDVNGEIFTNFHLLSDAIYGTSGNNNGTQEDIWLGDAGSDIQVQGEICFGADDSDCAGSWAGAGADTDWAFGASDDIYRLLGDVGIGIANPVYDLQVDRGAGIASFGLTGGTNRAWAISIGAANAIYGTNNEHEFITDSATRAVIGDTRSYFTGNVGIGTTTPENNLHILDDDKYLLTLQRSSYTDNDQALIRFANSGSSNVYSSYIGSLRHAGQSGRGDLVFGTNSGAVQADQILERMRITYNGNVGIGTTNPGAKLTISHNNDGIMQLVDSANGNTLQFGTDGDMLDFMRIRPTGGTGLAFTNNGDTVGLFVKSDSANIGIRTTTPSYPLSVNGSIYTNAHLLSDAIYGTSGNNNGTQEDIWLGDAGSDIQVQGEICFGTDNLDCADTWPTPGAADGYIGLVGPHTAGGQLNMGNFNLNLDGEWLSGDGTDEGIFVNSVGRVGINTNAPSESLQVVNSSGARVLFSDVSGTDRKGILFESPGTTHPTYGRIDVYDYSSGSPLDLILAPAGGDVGIDVTNPAAKLDVLGDIRASGGDLYANALYGRFGGVEDIWLGDANDDIQVQGEICFGADNLDCADTWPTPGAADGYIGLAGPHDAGGQLNMGSSNINLQGEWLSGDGTDEGIFVNTSGQVGVGASNPLGTLDVSNRFIVDTNLTSPDRWKLKLGDGSGWKGHIAQNDGDILMTFTDTGRLGIGNSGPSYSLDVANNNINVSGTPGNDVAYRVNNLRAIGVYPGWGGQDTLYINPYGGDDFTSGVTVAGPGLHVNGDITLNAGSEVDGYDISNWGQWFINGSGNAGNVWTSDGTGRGVWAPSGSGSDGYIGLAGPHNAGGQLNMLANNITLGNNQTVDGVDLSDYSDYFINSAGTNSYVWTSDGSGRGGWQASGSGSDGYIGLAGPHNAGGQLNMGSSNINLQGEWLSGDGTDEGVFVATSGNVGVGDSTPSYDLDVSGVIRASSDLRAVGDLYVGDDIDFDGEIFPGGATCTNDQILQKFGANDWRCADMSGGSGLWSAGSGNNIFYNESNGNVGIGISVPATKLDVREAGNFTPNTDYLAYIGSYAGAGTGSGLLVQSGWYNQAAPVIAQFSALASGYVEVPRLTIKSSGNVGIGTEDPDYLLDITGVLNLNKGETGGDVALRVTGQEALWYSTDTNIFSYGYGGQGNYFADPVIFGSGGGGGVDDPKIYSDENSLIIDIGS